MERPTCHVCSPTRLRRWHPLPDHRWSPGRLLQVCGQQTRQQRRQGVSRLDHDHPLVPEGHLEPRRIVLRVRNCHVVGIADHARAGRHTRAVGCKENGIGLRRAARWDIRPAGHSRPDDLHGADYIAVGRILHVAAGILRAADRTLRVVGRILRAVAGIDRAEEAGMAPVWFVRHRKQKGFARDGKR